MHLLQLLYAVALYPHVTQIYPKTLFSSQRWGEHRSHSSSQAARSRSQFSGQISIPFSSPKSRGHTAGHVGSPRLAASCSARPAKCQHVAAEQPQRSRGAAGRAAPATLSSASLQQAGFGELTEQVNPVTTPRSRSSGFGKTNMP